MKYLDLLMKLKEAGQAAEKCKRNLASIAESGRSELHQTANLKAAYMRAEGEFRKLKEQAIDHIKSSEDPELMRALYQFRVHGVPWEDMSRRILSNRSEMDLRLAAFEYIKQNYANREAYSDCF
jgi:hypothetical protein